MEILREITPKRLISVMGVAISLILAIQTFTIPYRIALSPFHVPETSEFEQGVAHSKPLMIGKLSLLSKSLNSSYSSEVVKEVAAAEISRKGREPNSDFKSEGIEEEDEEEGLEPGDRMEDDEDDFHLGEDGDPDRDFSVDLEDGVMLKRNEDSVRGFIELPNSLEKGGEPGNNANFMSDGISEPNPASMSKKTKPPGKALEEIAAKNDSSGRIPKVKNKKRVMPTISISEMNEILLKNHASYHSMRPRWFSARDKELLDAKKQIDHAPPVKSDPQLHAPAFRNISKFQRSYKLMDKILKVYVYKEGQKPIFHQPLLKGIYASEGWFMKLMETSQQYVVRDPKKAHLFYIPFSSRLLQLALYVRNSHKRRNLEQHMIDYVDTISRKYPFWNRTGGSDHFVAACHDWAAYETSRAMERSIRALCVADLNSRFRLGKDVSFPETYVRSAKNPQRDLGGTPANNRSTVAFYAGNMHGPLRTVLQNWENKDPDMKIYGPMPRGIARKMDYIQHMKSSKYCICPKGYEVNSPRIVESIFYECVPVIISDNFVPPFFEVLNWDAFSLIIPEKDVPRLKEILVSIPEEKYLLLQQAVRKVQQHFLWHSKPVKYDLFHMTLHSVWYNRVYNVRTR